jgi:hypothetical protein
MKQVLQLTSTLGNGYLLIPNKLEIIINKPQLAHGQLAAENEAIRVQGGYAVIILYDRVS